MFSLGRNIRNESIEDIWATLEENINQTAQLAVEKQNKMMVTKTSTGCGSSPPSSPTPSPLDMSTQV